MKVRLSDYNPQWPYLFKEECDVLTEILGSEVIRFEHFGSTSVKGMKAKPVIDMMVIVKDIEKIDQYNKIFELRGYDIAGEWGIAGRRLFRKDGEHRTHHIHIYEISNQEIKRHLLLRNYLRVNSKEVADYSKFKTLLSNKFEDTREYSKAKKEYVKNLEKRAIEYFK